MPAQRCGSCGATVKTLICEYCGSPTTDKLDPSLQMQALTEFHYILPNQPEETQVKMLRNGFLPDVTEVLIEAGLRCIPLIEVDDTPNEVVRAAAWRLRAVTTKLKLTSPSARVEQAIAEFEAVAAEFRRADRHLNLALAVVGVALLLSCLGGIVLLLS